MDLLTVLPTGGRYETTPAEKRRSLYCFPLVGLVIGVLLWLVWYLLGSSTWLAAMVVLIVWVVLTGALHLDGLADCVDALAGGHRDTTRTLAILRDPASGPMAVVALILVLGTKLVSLSAIFEMNAAAYLPMVPMISRIAIIILYGTTPYVRPGGLGESLSPSTQDRHWLWISLGVSTLVMLPFLGVVLVPALIAATMVFLWVRRAAMRSLRGFTGDVAGTMVELVETVSLLGIALIVSL